jgi:hypothetical protein
MTHHWDEFSKSLAEPIPRRESLRRLGVVFAGAVLSPLGLGTAWARGPDPCKSICKCRKNAQQNACLATCKACNGGTRRLCGACGSHYCADLANDVYNCGACGRVCPAPGPYEHVACVSGNCVYTCDQGAVRCDGTCTFLDSDPSNCGACGHVCDDPGPDEYVTCVSGTCEYFSCPPGTDYNWDWNNCGRCGNVCPFGTVCIFGTCDWGGDPGS